MGKRTQPTRASQLGEGKENKRDAEMESQWHKCIDWESKEEHRKEKNNSGDVVSIRCRRHRRRFNVPRNWAETTCDWLCPKCYDKLTPAERQRYAPTRPKSTPSPKPKAGKKKEKAKKIPIAAEQSRCHVQGVPKSAQNGTLFKGRCSLEALLPKWRLLCRKCNNERPVHRIWIDNTSKVLCPECYSSMTAEEVESFHRAHSDDEAKVFRVETVPVSNRAVTGTAQIDNIRACPEIPQNCESDVYGGRCTAEFIRRSTLKDLKKAVKEGKVSKVRAKIEMNRRRNSEYFNLLPDVETYRYNKMY